MFLRISCLPVVPRKRVTSNLAVEPQGGATYKGVSKIQTQHLDVGWKSFRMFWILWVAFVMSENHQNLVLSLFAIPHYIHSIVLFFFCDTTCPFIDVKNNVHHVSVFSMISPSNPSHADHSAIIKHKWYHWIQLSPLVKSNSNDTIISHSWYLLSSHRCAVFPRIHLRSDIHWYPMIFLWKHRTKLQSCPISSIYQGCSQYPTREDKN